MTISGSPFEHCWRVVALAQEHYRKGTIIPDLRTSTYLQPTGFTDDDVVARLGDGGTLSLDISLIRERVPGELLGIPGDGDLTALANRLNTIML